jgi:hypothetical protein
MGFESGIGVETACVHLVISPTSSFQGLDQVNSRMTQAYPGYLLLEEESLLPERKWRKMAIRRLSLKPIKVLLYAY